MSAPKIETFEYDIVDELKTKQASLVDIANNSGTIETKETSNTKTDTNKIILILLSVVVVIALIIFLTLNLTAPKQVPPLTQNSVASSTSQGTLKDILPTTNINIGRFVSTISTLGDGYAINILDYSSVYSYVLQNERSFGKELQDLFKIDTSTSTPQFKDVTLSNQDMRVLTTPNGTVVYAFVGNKGLAISTSTEGILTIRSVILSR